MTEGTYPGSSQPLRSTQRKVAALTGTQNWDKDPIRLRHRNSGKMVDYFTIGALSTALQRGPGTLRKWELLGYLPKAPRRTASDDPQHGKRRLYTRDEIEGLMRIAEEEGMYTLSRRRVSMTNFPQRARQLFDTLRGA